MPDQNIGQIQTALRNRQQQRLNAEQRAALEDALLQVITADTDNTAGNACPDADPTKVAYKNSGLATLIRLPAGDETAQLDVREEAKTLRTEALSLYVHCRLLDEATPDAIRKEFFSLGREADIESAHFLEFLKKHRGQLGLSATLTDEKTVDGTFVEDDAGTRHNLFDLTGRQLALNAISGEADTPKLAAFVKAGTDDEKRTALAAVVGKALGLDDGGALTAAMTHGFASNGANLNMLAAAAGRTLVYAAFHAETGMAELSAICSPNQETSRAELRAIAKGNFGYDDADNADFVRIMEASMPDDALPSIKQAAAQRVISHVISELEPAPRFELFAKLAKAVDAAAVRVVFDAVPVASPNLAAALTDVAATEFKDKAFNRRMGKQVHHVEPYMHHKALSALDKFVAHTTDADTPSHVRWVLGGPGATNPATNGRDGNARAQFTKEELEALVGFDMPAASLTDAMAARLLEGLPLHSAVVHSTIEHVSNFTLTGDLMRLDVPDACVIPWLGVAHIPTQADKQGPPNLKGALQPANGKALLIEYAKRLQHLQELVRVDLKADRGATSEAVRVAIGHARDAATEFRRRVNAIATDATRPGPVKLQMAVFLKALDSRLTALNEMQEYYIAKAALCNTRIAATPNATELSAADTAALKPKLGAACLAFHEAVRHSNEAWASDMSVAPHMMTNGDGEVSMTSKAAPAAQTNAEMKAAMERGEKEGIFTSVTFEEVKEVDGNQILKFKAEAEGMGKVDAEHRIAKDTKEATITAFGSPAQVAKFLALEKKADLMRMGIVNIYGNPTPNHAAFTFTLDASEVTVKGMVGDAGSEDKKGFMDLLSRELGKVFGDTYKGLQSSQMGATMTRPSFANAGRSSTFAPPAGNTARTAEDVFSGDSPRMAN
ncbi:MAG: hypothetical protein COB66_07420 [Coxiella sp. (in: Bacteria)]|nr:MAG: hypothetical protein COB66_07420 [Coxiella sp. (in: g-proteobacteria)]